MRWPMPAIGWANTVTTVRLVLAVSLWTVTSSASWLLVGIATAAAALDAVDGPLARRSGRASPFGARFDMETDAFLVLTLSVLVWRFGKAGAWILAAGVLRYLFVAASWPWPWMAAPLPPSRRRQAVCVVQIVSLIVALVPVVPRPLSDAVAGAGLAALVWSFWLDTRWLAAGARER